MKSNQEIHKKSESLHRKPVNFHAVKKNPTEVKIDFTNRTDKKIAFAAAKKDPQEVKVNLNFGANYQIVRDKILLLLKVQPLNNSQICTKIYQGFPEALSHDSVLCTHTTWKQKEWQHEIRRAIYQLRKEAKIILDSSTHLYGLNPFVETNQIEKLIDLFNKSHQNYNITKEGRKTATIEFSYERADDVLLEAKGVAEMLMNALLEGGENRTDSVVIHRQLPFDFPESYGLIIMRKVEEK